MNEKMNHRKTITIIVVLLSLLLVISINRVNGGAIRPDKIKVSNTREMGKKFMEIRNMVFLFLIFIFNLNFFSNI